MADIFEYVGNLHIHSRYSDGAWSVKDIALTAERAGHDFVVLNEHDFMTDSLHQDQGGFPMIGRLRCVVRFLFQYHSYR